MKQFTLKRVLSFLLALVMLSSVVFSSLPTSVFAADNKTAKAITPEQVAIVQKQLDAQKKQLGMQNQTVDKDKELKEELYKWAQERKEEEKARPTKEKFENMEKIMNIANEGIPMVISMIQDIADGGDFDTAGLVSNVADLACGILACFVPWGTVASIGLSLAKTLLMTFMGGEDGPSEIQLMEDRLNQRLDEIADQIAEVQDQLTELSDQINESTEMIISSVTTAIENESDKNHLRDFMLSSGKGDFSYNQLRNYLYGSTSDNSDAMTAYYALVQEAQLNGGSSEEIKHYYDLLYSGLMDSRTSFHHYITGDGFGKSIVQTYYDVLSIRPDLTAEMGMSAEMATIQFAYDLYQTELLMDQMILACNNYQYTQMVINGTTRYDYGSDYVLAGEILNEDKESVIAKSLNESIDTLRMQFAEDLVYVLGVTDTYMVEQNGKYYYHSTTEIDGVTCAQVLENQTIYFNRIPATAAEQFDLDAEAFTYEGIGLTNADGIAKVTSRNKNSQFALLYTDESGVKHYLNTIQFTDGEQGTFAGGIGTSDVPYLIATAEQFLNIADDMSAYYRLVKNIGFSQMDINPLGYDLNTVDAEVYEEFNGILDGDGFEIGGFQIIGGSHSGLFGKIGENGIVQNLKITGVNISVNISEATTSSSTFTGGVIAGTNNGIIDSCVVDNCQLIVKSTTDNADAERNVYFKYGGVAGVNCGAISAVLVKSSSVNVSATHSFGGADTSNNQNHVFVGGICGTCPGTLDYAGVDENVHLRAYAKSSLSPKSTVNPYVKAYVGGITTDEGLDIANVSNIYSAIPDANLSATRELQVNSGWGKHYKNAKARKDALIPEISDDKLKDIKATWNDVEQAFAVQKTYEVSIEDHTKAYPVGALELDNEKLEIIVNSEKVEDFYIMNLYGFSTYNESYDKVRTIEVTMLFSAQIDGEEVMLTGDFLITIDKNHATAIELINYETNYFKGDSVSTLAMLDLWDANGKMSTVTNAQINILNADTATAEVGTRNLEVEYLGAVHNIEIEVLCNVHYKYLDYNNPEHFTFVESVSPDCQHGGYDAYRCLGCQEIVKTNRTGIADHNIVREVSREATCAEPGMIGKIYCTYCDEVFEEQVEVPRLAHNIVNEGHSENHYCTLCEKHYAHDYVVSESIVDGTMIYTYTCYSCGYVGQMQDANIITNEARLLPTVVVSDGFARQAGDLVTIYVDLENNPGVNGANFGIRYDERLELVQWYEGDFFAGTTTEASHAVSCGYNYVWGTEIARTDSNGNLLRLVFRLPEDATRRDSYEVAVVYSVVAGSEGGFVLPDAVCATLGIPSNYPEKFKTKDGVIQLVDRLPGDVDNNSLVNLMDALYLSNCLVNQEQYPITTEIMHYGDVNLDRMVAVSDVVKILQSISGGYGASLMSPEYRIQLNTNGYPYQPEALFVQLYGANNTYAALAEIEQDMQQREGYKFMGWYTRLVGGKKIDAENYMTELVSYDRDQKVQTLYAHWQKNAVIFDMNGATSPSLEKVTYLGNGEQWIELTAPVEEYKIIFADPAKQISSVKETMSHEFLYWMGSDGNRYYAGERLPVHKLNMGELTLTAEWGEWELNVPILEKGGYDSTQITWCSNENCTDVVDIDDFESIKALDNKTLYAKWVAPITYYIHYDANGGTGTMPDEKFTYDAAPRKLSDNVFTNSYNVTFDFGWEGQDPYVQSVTHTYKNWSLDGTTALKESEKWVSNWTMENNKVISVYALWSKETIELREPTERTGYVFDGWYTDPGFSKFAGKAKATIETTGACTLYAKWVLDEYDVILEDNMVGSNGVTNASVQCYTTPSIKTQAIKDAITYSVTGTYLSVPQTDHYNFDGWFTEPVGGIQITDSDGKVIRADVITADGTKLYAHWTKSYQGTYIYDEDSLRTITGTGTYHIVKDIELKREWIPLESFSGEIDGHGHTVTGVVYVTSTQSTNTVNNYGFVRILSGTIKNINFDSAKIQIVKSKDGQHNLSVGCVAGYMQGGTIENVHMYKSSAYAEHHRDVASSGEYSNAFAGGLVGFMSGGTINNCSISGESGVYTWAKKATSRADAQAFSGGIVGYMTGGTVSNCSRSDSVVVESKSEVDGKNSASRAASGGIIGVKDGGTYKSCTSTTNNLKTLWDNGSYSKDYSWKVTGAIVGRGG